MIRRSARTFSVSVLPTGAVNDRRLTFGARGLLLFLLSKPDGWRVSIRALIGEAPGTGREAVQTLLRELERTGYLRRTQTQNSKGHFEWHQDVFDVPEIPDLVATGEPCTVQPCTANPYMVRPCTANPYMVMDPDPSRARNNQSAHAGSGAGTRVSDYCQNANQNAPTHARAPVNPRAHAVKVVDLVNTSLPPSTGTGLVKTGLGDAPALGEEEKEDNATQALGEAGEVELAKQNKGSSTSTAKPCAQGVRGVEQNPPYLITHARNKETRACEENTNNPQKTRKKRGKTAEKENLFLTENFPEKGTVAMEEIEAPCLTTPLLESKGGEAQEKHENRPSLSEPVAQDETPERFPAGEESLGGAAAESAPKRRGRKPGKMEIKPTQSGGGKLVQRFIDNWTLRYGQRPAGVDGARLGKAILECQRIAECEEEETLQAIDVYFAMEDEWILTNLHPWQALKGRFDRCLRTARGLSSVLPVETKEAREARRLKEIGDRGVQIARQNGWVTDTRSEEEKAQDTDVSIIPPVVKIPTLDEIFHPSRYKKGEEK